MSPRPLAGLAGCAAAVALSLLAAPAAAITRTLTLQQNGPGACQVALPVYESLVRRRPLAIQNEGTGVAFITCSPLSLQGLPANDTLGYTVRVINNGPGVASVKCTAVVGTQGIANPVYLPKTVAVAGASSALLTWRTFDGYTTFLPFNLSCELPPGTGVSAIEISQTLDVGA